RDGRLPAHRLWRRNGLPAPGVASPARSARGNRRRHRVIYDLILAGFGNVARRFVRLLDELRPDLAREHGLETRIVAIAPRSRGCGSRPQGLSGSMLATLVEEGGRLGPLRRSTLQFVREIVKAHADAARHGRLVLVEATTLDIVRGQPATDHVLAALRGGAHV